jgi:hypothetical protein
VRGHELVPVRQPWLRPTHRVLVEAQRHRALALPADGQRSQALKTRDAVLLQMGRLGEHMVGVGRAALGPASQLPRAGLCGARGCTAPAFRPRLSNTRASLCVLRRPGQRTCEGPQACTAPSATARVAHVRHVGRHVWLWMAPCGGPLAHAAPSTHAPARLTKLRRMGESSSGTPGRVGLPQSEGSPVGGHESSTCTAVRPLRCGHLTI